MTATAPGTAERTIVNPWQWQDAFGYAQAVHTVGGRSMLHCAGQVSMGPDGTPMHATDMGAQLHLALDNLETVLTQAGFELGDVVRFDIHTTDVDECLAHYAPIAERLGAAGCIPASTLVGVTRLAFPELLVELTATAIR